MQFDRTTIPALLMAVVLGAVGLLIFAALISQCSQ